MEGVLLCYLIREFECSLSSVGNEREIEVANVDEGAIVNSCG